MKKEEKKEEEEKKKKEEEEKKVKETASLPKDDMFTKLSKLPGLDKNPKL